MRQAAVALILGCVLLMITAIYVLNSLAIVQRYAIVDAMEGKAQVLIHGRGDPAPLRLGELVRAGDVVTTGPGSSVELRWVRLAGGMRLKIGPETRFTITRAIVNRSKKEQESRLRVDHGRIWVRIREALTGRSKFEVETPTVVAAVRGTVFSVAVGSDGTSEVEVYEGQVTVAGVDGAAASLTSGSQTTVRPGQRAAETSPLPPECLAEWRTHTSVIGPFLEVTAPVDGALVEADSVLVTGRTEPGVQVFVSAIATALSEKGEFSRSVKLQPGMNLVVVTAEDVTGRETMIVRTVHSGEGAASP